MIAPPPQDYLLLREIAPLAGISDQVLRRQVKAGRIPPEFVQIRGAVRPIIRISRAWLERRAAPQPALACEIVLPWGGP